MPTAGRFEVQIDPAGYQRAIEPGFDWEIRGNELSYYLGSDQDGLNLHNLWNPRGSEWLLTLPRQWTPDWYANANVKCFTLAGADWFTGRQQWMFASGLGRREFEPANVAGQTPYSDYQWLSIAANIAGATSLMGVDFAAIAAAADVTLPAGMIVGAVAIKTPTGLDGGEYPFTARDFTPHVDVACYPGQPVVFGFHNICLILGIEDVRVLRRKASGGWELLRTIQVRDANMALERLRAWGSALGAASGLFSLDLQQTAVTVLAAPDHMYVCCGGAAHAIRMRPNSPSGYARDLFVRGPWWIGVSPRHPVTIHVEVVGYKIGRFPPEGDSAPVMFDLGAAYMPEETPKGTGMVWFGGAPGGRVTWANTDGSGHEATTEAGHVARYKLLDDLGLPWVSDGIAHAGGLEVYLRPDNSFFLATGIRVVGIRFPESLEARWNDAFSFSDLQYARFRVEAALREPAGKRVEVDFTRAQLDSLDAAGIGTRKWYPFHVVEGVSDGEGGSTDTVRARGWVHEPELEEVRVATDAAPTAFVRLYTLGGQGVLSRLEGAWERLPQIVDPDGWGYIEWDYAVKEVARSRGIDTDDPTQFYCYPDPYKHPTDRTLTASFVFLPGTWANYNPNTGATQDCAWAPDWDESPLQYVERIVTQWRGWVIYEDLAGKVWIHPDQILESRLGASHYSSCTLYRSRADAQAAGVPGMVYQARPRWRTRLHYSQILLMGAESGEEVIPQLIDRVSSSQFNVTSPNYLGEPRTKQIVSKLALDRNSKRQLARVARHKWCYGLQEGAIEIAGPAPWEFEPNPADVGHVILLDGTGYCLVIHAEVEQLRANPAFYRTHLAVERLPATAVPSFTPGPYPGIGGD